ncbi:DUF3073 domain-containing protein [Nocardiopsis sp. RSe5-2]|uniref:DUF3073 domain-containing protein n=1 Tax=Nocardiopsis endophytica TaxID=3018445 RepID=A0ABT4UC93_9ACTN|nr:DUF3073 domain-containing protein [Nocardiopsis endophytica]MDA2814586.1 DUF3073 domain-containing protein [Nocardiopsis endophytica]
MGRGRAKAKQQKVARRLKYSTGGTDLDRLRSELGVAEDENGAPSDAAGGPDQEPYDDLVERYADLAERYSSPDGPSDEGSDRSEDVR